MQRQIFGLRVASVIFGLMSIAQLVRFIIRGRIVLGGHMLPFWPSALAFFVLAGLSIWLWSLSREK